MIMCREWVTCGGTGHRRRYNMKCWNHIEGDSTEQSQTRLGRASPKTKPQGPISCGGDVCGFCRRRRKKDVDDGRAVVVDAPATVVIVCVKIKAFGKRRMSAWTRSRSVRGGTDGAFFPASETLR